MKGGTMKIHFHKTNPAALSLLAAAIFGFLASTLGGAGLLAAVSNNDGLSLERIYADPRLDGVPPREPSWSPVEPLLAYLWSDLGLKQRDLWIHDPRTGVTKKIADSAALAASSAPMDEATAERRQTMRLDDAGVDAYQWSPDGKRIQFSLAGDIYLVEASGGEPRQLTTTPEPEFDPQFSPDGRKIAFVRENDLWVMEIMNKAQVRVTSGGSETMLNGLSDYIALEELDRKSAYRWSADGMRLIFIQSDTSPVRQLEIPDFLGRYVTHRLQRRPPAGETNARTRVGVASASGGQTRWIQLRKGLKDFYIPKLESAGDYIILMQQGRDLRRAWLNLAQPAKFVAPFLLQESDAAWINLDRSFIGWDEADKQLIWGSERSGFGHLYKVDLASGRFRPITTGEWEVTDLDQIRDGKAFFTATREGPAERHFYSVPLEGGDSTKLTTMPGWNVSTMSSDGEWLAILYSNITSPTDLFVSRIGSGETPGRITRSPAPDFAKLDLPEPEFISMSSRLDGASISGMLFRPSTKAPKGILSAGGKHPAIVRIHGAGYSQSNRKAWGGTTYLFHVLMARQGYYVLDVEYRGSRGYGRKWRTDVYLNMGGPDLQDSITGADYLRALPDVDSNRVGIWGWSYGGYVTNMAMLAEPDSFNAGVAVAPVNVLANYDTHWTEERMGRPQDHEDAYRKGSPLTYVKGLKNPLLMIHGLRDDNVHAQDTMLLADALIKAGKDFDMMLYPEGKHGIRSDASRIHLFKKIRKFFAEKMPPGK
jgi:dipeptidyl-peptidase-4